jgi:hypothetical protein
MLKNILNTEEWVYLIFITLLSIMFFHQAWANLIQRKISKFSFDRLMLILSDSFASSKNRMETRKLIKDPKRLLISGLIALLAFMGFITEIIKWLKNFF